MKIVYGVDVQESDDPYISMAEEVLNGLAEAGIPGAFWVDIFPALKYVPSWFPGAGFQKKAARWREAINIMAENPFRHVQEQLVRFQILVAQKSMNNDLLNMQKNGKATPSVAASLIESLPDEGDPQHSEEKRIAKDVAWVVYAGTWRI